VTQAHHEESDVQQRARGVADVQGLRQQVTAGLAEGVAAIFITQNSSMTCGNFCIVRDVGGALALVASGSSPKVCFMFGTPDGLAEAS
jgi:hypothetical protein